MPDEPQSEIPESAQHELSAAYRAEPLRSEMWRLEVERAGTQATAQAAPCAHTRGAAAHWPVRGEPNLRSWRKRAIARGGRIALPVVFRKAWPLECRFWSHNDPLEHGVWNILIAAHEPAVQPDIVIAPVVGCDEARCIAQATAAAPSTARSL